MLHESSLVRERFVAEFTLVGLANPVHHFVCTQLVDASEPAAALCALERPLGSALVHLSVHRQPLSCWEHPLAARAWMLFLTAAGAIGLSLLLHEQTWRRRRGQAVDGTTDSIPVVFVVQYFLCKRKALTQRRRNPMRALTKARTIT